MDDQTIQNAFYYFFSANAQVFAALIAILGVFTVYALQYLQSSIEWSREDLVRTMNPLGLNVSTFTLDTQLKKAEVYLLQMASEGQTDSRVEETRHAIAVIKEQREWRLSITKNFTCLLILMSIVLGSSLISLPLSALYMLYKNLFIMLLIIVLILSILSIILMTLFINNTLKRYPQKSATWPAPEPRAVSGESIWLRDFWRYNPMKIFKPIETLSTDKLLNQIENLIAVVFCAGFFTGIAMGIILSLNEIDISPSRENLLWPSFIFLLMLFLSIHIYARKRILPELKKRIETKPPEK